MTDLTIFNKGDIVAALEAAPLSLNYEGSPPQRTVINLIRELFEIAHKRDDAYAKSICVELLHKTAAPIEGRLEYGASEDSTLALVHDGELYWGDGNDDYFAIDWSLFPDA